MAGANGEYKCPAKDDDADGSFLLEKADALECSFAMGEGRGGCE